ncbi:hypothetical protein U27_05105 [Candidatus Vecturithrix granuli]|uniref:ABC transporter substrate binding protein n=1 Tax=Vecturithrix granuli TaxID=1499967 RepID=A0A081C0M7_VECG1|nr:hypothetical protein U27_05105 [Candidatus Vecturithrix granuli]
MKRMVTMSVLLVVLFGMFENIGFAAEMKTVVSLRTDMMPPMTEYILKGLEQAGFVPQENITFQEIIISTSDDIPQLISRVKEAQPDVVLNAVEFPDALAALKGLSFPVVTRLNVEPYVNAEGIPTANITGMYSTLHDMFYNSYKFLRKVAPLKAGQAVVLLDNPEFAPIPKAKVMDALQRLQIPLKAVVNATVYEDWQAAALQYSDDPEVGWILRSSPTRKRDGSRLDMKAELYPWQREYFQKPTVTYWEEPVQLGTLCAFGMDIHAMSMQFGRMAARVLQGESIQSIKAEYPQKIRIALNRKTATNLGIVFSTDVLKLANVIYDDYEGKQVIRK